MYKSFEADCSRVLEDRSWELEDCSRVLEDCSWELEDCSWEPDVNTILTVSKICLTVLTVLASLMASAR